MNAQVIFERHVFFAEQCLADHTLGYPFDKTLKNYFRVNKKFGSKDRRRIKSLCYSWFRLGFSFADMSKDQQIILSFLVLEPNLESYMLNSFKELTLHTTWLDWNLNERISFLENNTDWKLSSTYPDITQVSVDFEPRPFLIHSMKQSKLWVRPSEKANEIKLFQDIESVTRHPSGALGLETGVNKDLEKYRRYFEVQDLSCQLAYNNLDLNGVKTVWDCCSASGGKSLLLLDKSPNIKIYASDKRVSILKDFAQRTRRYSKRIHTSVTNLEEHQKSIVFKQNGSKQVIQAPFFDVIVADVPCTGSGTWNRNPEFKVGFQHTQNTFKKLQVAIVQNAMPFLKKGGILFYSTCSVYKEENEQVLNELVNSGYEKLQSGYIKGYQNDSDSMYFAKIRKI